MITAVRYLTAAAVAFSGYIHLDRYLNGFDALPVVGPLFLANALAAAVIALVLVVRRGIVGPIAAALFSASALVSLVLAKTVGFFGISPEAPLNTQEILSFGTEGLALVLAVGLLIWRRSGDGQAREHEDSAAGSDVDAGSGRDRAAV